MKIFHTLLFVMFIVLPISFFINTEYIGGIFYKKFGINVASDSAQTDAKLKTKSDELIQKSDDNIITKTDRTHKYFCPKDNTKIKYSPSNIYEIDVDCESWNTPEYLEKYPNIYKNCINSQSELKSRYDAGKCFPVVKRYHKINEVMCTYEVIEEHKIIVSKTCTGKDKDIRAAEKVLKKVYSEWQ